MEKTSIETISKRKDLLENQALLSLSSSPVSPIKLSAHPFFDTPSKETREKFVASENYGAQGVLYYLP